MLDQQSRASVCLSHFVNQNGVKLKNLDLRLKNCLRKRMQTKKSLTRFSRNYL